MCGRDRFGGFEALEWSVRGRKLFGKYRNLRGVAVFGGFRALQWAWQKIYLLNL